MASSKCPWWALVWPLCGCFGGSSTWPFLVSSECACPQLRTLRVLDESVRSCPWGPGKKLKNPAGLGRSGTSLSLMASRRRPWCVLGCHCAAVLVYPVMVPGRAQGVLVLSCIPGASWVNPCGPVLGGREKKEKTRPVLGCPGRPCPRCPAVVILECIMRRAVPGDPCVPLSSAHILCALGESV